MPQRACHPNKINVCYRLWSQFWPGCPPTTHTSENLLKYDFSRTILKKYRFWCHPPKTPSTGGRKVWVHRFFRPQLKVQFMHFRSDFAFRLANRLTYLQYALARPINCWNGSLRRMGFVMSNHNARMLDFFYGLDGGRIYSWERTSFVAIQDDFRFSFVDFVRF